MVVRPKCEQCQGAGCERDEECHERHTAKPAPGPMHANAGAAVDTSARVSARRSAATHVRAGRQAVTPTIAGTSRG
jgi:hypothetical protein